MIDDRHNRYRHICKLKVLDMMHDKMGLNFENIKESGIFIKIF